MTDPPLSCQSHSILLAAMFYISLGEFTVFIEFYSSTIFEMADVPYFLRCFPHFAHTVLQSCGFLSIPSNFLVHFFEVSAWSLKFGASHNSEFASFSSSFCTCFFFFQYLFIYLTALGLSCGVWDPVLRPGVKPGPLLWECRVLDTGPPEKSLLLLLSHLGRVQLCATP